VDLGTLSEVGLLAGSVLLLLIPASVFAASVPVLIGGASLAVALPAARRRRRRTTGRPVGSPSPGSPTPYLSFRTY
jgi:uncharacterized protein